MYYFHGKAEFSAAIVSGNILTFGFAEIKKSNILFKKIIINQFWINKQMHT